MQPVLYWFWCQFLISLLWFLEDGCQTHFPVWLQFVDSLKTVYLRFPGPWALAVNYFTSRHLIQISIRRTELPSKRLHFSYFEVFNFLSVVRRSHDVTTESRSSSFFVYVPVAWKWVENLDHTLPYLDAVMWKMYARGCLFSSNLAILVRSSILLVWATGTFVNSLNTNKTGSWTDHHEQPTSFLWYTVLLFQQNLKYWEGVNLDKHIILLQHFFTDLFRMSLSPVYPRSSNSIIRICSPWCTGTGYLF